MESYLHQPVGYTTPCLGQPHWSLRTISYGIQVYGQRYLMNFFHNSVISKVNTNRCDTTDFSIVSDVIGHVLRTTRVHYERVATLMIHGERSPDLHISFALIIVTTIDVLFVFQLFLYLGPARKSNVALLVASVTTHLRLAFKSHSCSSCVWCVTLHVLGELLRPHFLNKSSAYVFPSFPASYIALLADKVPDNYYADVRDTSSTMTCIYEARVNSIADNLLKKLSISDRYSPMFLLIS